VQSIDPLLLGKLHANDPTLARRVALDIEDLKRRAGQVDQVDEVVVLKEVQSSSRVQIGEIEIHFVVPHPIGHRLDRLLAAELRMPRSEIHAMERHGALLIVPRGSRALRSSVRDGLRLTIATSAVDVHRLVEAATRNGPPP
jgi:hypothetical protein